jgi:hypothetical protein
VNNQQQSRDSPPRRERQARMSAFRSILLLLGCAAASAMDAAPTRVLFIGNSFTFVNDLPHQLANIARSLGKEVVVANSTIGGCTLYFQRAETDARTAELLEQDWDYIVLQSYSNLPTVKKARETYLTPAVQSFVAKKKKAKIVMYLTWGYHSGNVPPPCPSGSGKCFPLGTNAELTSPPCNQSGSYQAKVDSFPCMVRPELPLVASPGSHLGDAALIYWNRARRGTRLPVDTTINSATVRT